MDRLNLNQLRTLVTLLEERNVTKAGEKLLLTQSAMSKQLGQLRAYFDDPLLIRDGNRYLLSARAGEVLPKVQAILSDIDNLKTQSTFDPAECTRRFRFACTDYVAQFIFPKVIMRLWAEAPGVDVGYDMLQPGLVEHLGRHPVDFVSIMSPSVPDHVHAIDLGADVTVCMMAQDHPLAQCEMPILEDLLRYAYVRVSSGSDKDSFFDRHLQGEGLSRRIAFEVPFFSAAFEVISQSDRLMIVPGHIASNATKHFPVTYRQLPMAVPQNKYWLCWHEMYDKDVAHAWVRSCIAEEMQASIYSPSPLICGYEF